MLGHSDASSGTCRLHRGGDPADGAYTGDYDTGIGPSRLAVSGHRERCSVPGIDDDTGDQ